VAGTQIKAVIIGSSRTHIGHFRAAARLLCDRRDIALHIPTLTPGTSRAMGMLNT
jgi:aconitase B